MSKSKLIVVLNVSGGVVQEAYTSDPDLEVVIVDWDANGNAPDDVSTFTVDLASGDQTSAFVSALPIYPLAELAGTDVGAALTAAEVAAA